NSVPTAKPPTTPAATSPLPATADRGVHVRQRLPVINRPTTSFRMLAPPNGHHYLSWIKAELMGRIGRSEIFALAADDDASFADWRRRVSFVRPSSVLK